MVDISEKVEKIKELIDSRCYFTINRAAIWQDDYIGYA